MGDKLRPYYNHDTFDAGYLVIFRPGVGLIDTATDKPILATLAQNSSFAPGKGIGLAAPVAVVSPDKNYVHDLELLEYLDASNLVELAKNLAYSFFRSYCRVLFSQPLETVRLVLQVGAFDFSHKGADEASDEEVDYFAALHSPLPLPQPKSRPKSNKIQPVSRHTVDIMGAVAARDGPFALFRGVNASFIHYTLSHTIEAWITGFLSPFLGIPDPFFLDLTHLPEPAKLLWLSVTACVLAGVVLAPLDLIKVRLMLTPLKPPQPLETGRTVNVRSVRDSIRNYPPALLVQPPPTITLLTLLHQCATTIFRKSAPYLLFVRFNIDAYQLPYWYTSFNLAMLITELFIKLPVENLLRKEQVRFLLKPKTLQEDPHRVVTIDDPDENLIVNFNGHHTQGTLYEQLRLYGLFNGWRVGVLNVIGFWGYNIFKSTAVVEERL